MERKEKEMKRQELLTLAEACIGLGNDFALEQAKVYLQLADYYNTRPL